MRAEFTVLLFLIHQYHSYTQREPTVRSPSQLK